MALLEAELAALRREGRERARLISELSSQRDRASRAVMAQNTKARQARVTGRVRGREVHDLQQVRKLPCTCGGQEGKLPQESLLCQPAAVPSPAAFLSQTPAQAGQVHEDMPPPPPPDLSPLSFPPCRSARACWHAVLTLRPCTTLSRGSATSLWRC